MKTPVDTQVFFIFNESDLFTSNLGISTIVRKFRYKMMWMCINMIFYVDM